MIRLELVFPSDFQGGNMPFREDLIKEFEYSRPLSSLREKVTVEGMISNDSHIVLRR
jgi:hypothetical protein